MLQTIDTVDKTVIVWIHNNHNHIMDYLMPIITDADNWVLPILALILYLGIKCGKRGKITLVLLIFALALTDSICAQLLKPFFERIRPSHIGLDGLNLLVSKGGKWSMPSNHAANIFSFAVILSYFYEKYKRPLFVLAFLISFSRVYVGVHYPSDVIAGSIFGYALAWLVRTLWVILKMRELKRRQSWVWYEDTPPLFKD